MAPTGTSTEKQDEVILKEETASDTQTAAPVTSTEGSDLPPVKTDEDTGSSEGGTDLPTDLPPGEETAPVVKEDNADADAGEDTADASAGAGANIKTELDSLDGTDDSAEETLVPETVAQIEFEPEPVVVNLQEVVLKGWVDQIETYAAAMAPNAMRTPEEIVVQQHRLASLINQILERTDDENFAGFTLLLQKFEEHRGGALGEAYLFRELSAAFPIDRKQRFFRRLCTAFFAMRNPETRRRAVGEINTDLIIDLADTQIARQRLGEYFARLQLS